jgi:colanic acid/amylovoran biosynthesis glycosyltransferase
LAFTCLDGHNRLPSADPLVLRRTPITPRTSGFVFGLRLLKPITYIDQWRHRPKRSSPGHGAARDRFSRLDVGAARPRKKVAYIMSRFPKLSETFVLNEMIALESLGADIALFPLLRETQPVSHPEAEHWVQRARFSPFVSRAVLRAQAHFIRHRPRAYFGVLYEVLRKTAGSRNFFFGALGSFPKSVRFAYEMMKDGVTHVHAHFCTHPAVAALIIHRLTGIPFSFTAHGSDLHVDRRMLDRKVEAAAFAVTISRYNREIMVRECGEQARSKIHVVRCGVDVTYFAPRVATGGDDSFQIVCVASLEPVKGHRYLIEACRLLKERRLAFRCHLVGDGPCRADIERQIAWAGLQEHVHIHGGRPRPDVARLLARAHAFVLASHPTPDGKREGVPVALMEAMASGVAVVATDISGIPELVETEVSGLLVPASDAAAIADAVQRLYGDPALRRRLGAAARAKVLREFDLQVNAAALLDLFCRVHPSPRMPLRLARPLPDATGRSGVTRDAAGSAGAVGSMLSPGGDSASDDVAPQRTAASSPAGHSGVC